MASTLKIISGPAILQSQVRGLTKDCNISLSMRIRKVQPKREPGPSVAASRETKQLMLRVGRGRSFPSMGLLVRVLEEGFPAGKEDGFNSC